MQRKIWLAVLLIISAMLLFNGCANAKKWVGWGSDEDEEMAGETVPPESQQETVMIDGKPYVRSKNPYWLSYPQQPEYIYVEKGKEFVPMQQRLIEAIAKAVGKEKDKGGKTIPPDIVLLPLTFFVYFCPNGKRNTQPGQS